MAARTKKSRKILTASAVLAAAVIVAMLALISPEMSLLATGFFASVGFVMSDLKRRRFWENSLSFQMRNLSDKHDALAQKVTATRAEVLNLRQNVADINHRLHNHGEKIDDIHPKNIAASLRSSAAESKVALMDDILPAQAKPAASRPAAPVPHAVRPGQKPAPQSPLQQKIANDAEYNDLSDMVVRELVTYAVRAKNIEVFVQPIVRLPQRRVRFFEMYARVRARPGMYLPARRYMKLAQETELTNEIDNMLLMECLKIVKNSSHIERAAPLFINVSSTTLKNTSFMKQLLDFIAKNRDLAPRLIFEMPYGQFNALESGPKEILRGLGRLGCSVSLDHIDVLEFDIEELQRYNVRFAKVGAKTLMPYTRSDRGRADFQRIKRRLESNGISMIVEKIESENDLLELLDFDIAYGQGHLFGRPDLEAAYRKRRAAA